jgi:hypothetical protein
MSSDSIRVMDISVSQQYPYGVCSSTPASPAAAQGPRHPTAHPRAPLRHHHFATAAHLPGLQGADCRSVLQPEQQNNAGGLCQVVMSATKYRRNGSGERTRCSSTPGAAACRPPGRLRHVPAAVASAVGPAPLAPACESALSEPWLSSTCLHFQSVQRVHINFDKPHRTAADV